MTISHSFTRYSHSSFCGLYLLVLIATLAGCGSSDSGGEDDPPVTDPQPVGQLISATNAPTIGSNNQVSWSFAPIPSELVVKVQPYIEMPLASNGRPARWNDFETLGDRSFLVDEQDGRIYEITNQSATLWFDIANAISSHTGRTLSISNPFHGGVRGIAFHPEFKQNGKFYAALMEQRPDNPTNHHYLSDDSAIDADSVLVEWTADPATMTVDIASYREVFRVGVPYYDHPIKQVAFNWAAARGDESYGLLYIAHGDGSVESETVGGGEDNNALGKILRINPLSTNDDHYTVPPTNPFLDDNSLPDEVYSYGHRNPHHLAFTAAGELLSAEAGRDNIDEINLIVAGANYGWSQREGAYLQLEVGTLATGVAALPDNDVLSGYTYPVAQFGHTGPAGSTFTHQALGGGYVVENGSELDGQYVYIDFVRSGAFFHSSINDIRAANTQGDPQDLTLAQTYEAKVVFDHDENPNTPALNQNLKSIVMSASGYVNTLDRVDIRIGQGSKGELYLYSKRNNMVYVIVNSLPEDAVN